MTAFAQTLQRQQQEAAAVQSSERTKRRVVRRSPVSIEPLSTDDAEPPEGQFGDDHGHDHRPQEAVDKVASPVMPPPALPAPVTVELGAVTGTAVGVASNANNTSSASPLDLPTEFFSAGMDRRKRNRTLLMEWLRTALVEGVDFGRIHLAGRDRCQMARMGRVHECKEAGHWSKPSLFKPGAEKITGILGVAVHYPTLPAYEDAILAQADIRTIMLRCELRDAHGHVVAQGAGARQVSQDYGDLNKSLKMVAKSAHIDATLRLAGLSEVFTQDLEDRPPTGEFETVAVVPPPAPASPPPPPPSPPHPTSPPLPPPPRPAAKAPPRQPTATTDKLIDIEQLQDLREAIAEHGFAEQRVLNWLYQATKGQVSQLEQLPLAMLTTLHKRLGQWAGSETAGQVVRNTPARATAPLTPSTPRAPRTYTRRTP